MGPLNTPAQAGGTVWATAGNGTVAGYGHPHLTTVLPSCQQERIVIQTDGLCEPRNPGGWACWAWVAIAEEAQEIASGHGCIGHGPGATNNVAEYQAVLAALDWAISHELADILIQTDSKLVVEQVAGHWQCNASHLRGLRDEVRARLAGCTGRLEWVPREQNTRADALSRLAYAAARRGGYRG